MKVMQARDRREFWGSESADRRNDDIRDQRFLRPVRQAQAGMPGAAFLVIAARKAFGTEADFALDTAFACHPAEIAFDFILRREKPRPVSTVEGVGIKVARRIHAAAGIMM